MARYQLTLAYDGTDFFGSQRQATKRTVQGELEKTLRRLGWTGSSILLSGRTDTGVHATGQVAAFDLDWTHPAEELQRALNASLPSDLAVWQVRQGDDKFHPRFDAITRSYRYQLFCHPIRDPMAERFAWRVWPIIDGEVLRQAASAFVGTHDFRAVGSPTSSKGTTVRTITSVNWQQTAETQWTFDVQADAFLYRMVRRMVFVQIATAQHRAEVETITEALQDPAQGKRLPAGLAPAHGLTLVAVGYQESNG